MSIWRLATGVALGTVAGRLTITAVYVLGIEYGWAWWVLEWLK